MRLSTRPFFKGEFVSWPWVLVKDINVFCCGGPKMNKRRNWSIMGARNESHFEVEGTMLSYRHAYHAGNPADVFKHAVLVALVRAMQHKEKGIRFIDTHSGPALYDLQCDMAGKNHEFEYGIGRLWDKNATSALVKDYLGLVSTFNTDGQLRFYPGSPMLLHSLLRLRDEMILCELHPAEQRELARRFGKQSEVRIKPSDGYAALAGLLPPPTGRALVLIDPSFELRSELDDMVSALQVARKRCAHCVYAIWYPVIEGRNTIPNTFPANLQLTDEQWLDLRIDFAPDQCLGRMVGCGMAIINCPFRAREPLADMAVQWKKIASPEF